MTQIPQDDFETCLEKAEAWMKSIHERLKVNDNTQGPRSALEARLRETEKICALEPDGKMLVDMVLIKAKTLLSDSSEEEKHEIQVKQGKIKTMFEETITYMTHCHSRIEWVWLHWNEYLRARDEFTLWVHNMILTLGPDVELQLGLKEKCWQYEQALVLQREVHNQSRLLDRLLEEAASLYNRIGDPSVDESVQSAMMAEYKQIKKKTKERVSHLEKVWRDHEAYENEVNHFKSWLNSVIEKLKCCIGAASDSTEHRLNMLREIGKDVECGEKQLEVLEGKSAEVIKNTSPLGTEKIRKELEELRKTLAELKLMNNEEEDSLLKTYNSENAFLQLARQLQANIVEFRKAIQRLEESLECGERVKSEDELLALWKTLNATKSALAAEEAKAERVKVQLKDLFKFSKDVQPLSDEVIAAMRDYQRAKSKAFKLSTETESELRQLFQNPLREFLYWKPIAESVLDSTAVPVNDRSMNQDSIDNIERLLGESSAIQEKLAELEKKKDRILSVLGDDKTSALLSDISAAEQQRDALHRDLQQRKNALQSFAAESEEFESAFKSLRKQLSAIRARVAKENEPQPDIIGKEAQLNRLQILLEDLTKLNTPLKALSSMTESNPSHAHRASKLSSDYLMLQRTLETNMRKSKDNISHHWLFTNALQDLQHWIMVSRGTLEAYRDGSKDWTDEDMEALLAENSGKDVQRHQVEALGQQVMGSSSPEGAAIIQTEINHLHDSWVSLQQLFNQLSRTLKERQQQRGSPKTMKSPTTVTANQTSGFISDMDPSSPILHGRGGTSKELNIGYVNYDGHVIANSGHNGVPGKQDLTGDDSRRVGITGKQDLTGDDSRRVGITGKQGFNQGGGDFSSSDHEPWRFSATGNLDNDPGFPQSDNSVRIISPGHGKRSTGQSETTTIRSQADGAIAVTSRVSGPSDSNANAASVEYGKPTLFISYDMDSNSSIGQSDNRKMNTKRSQGHTGKPGSTEQEASGLTHTGESGAGYEHDGSVGFISPGRGKRSPGRSTKCNKSSESPGIDLTSSFVAENNVKEREGKSPSNPGTSRRNRTLVSLAESVDIVDSALSTGGNKAGDDPMKLLMQFEQWLQVENSKLSRICATEISSSDGIKTRQSNLQKLQQRVPQGQKLLTSLLLCRPSMSLTEDLRLEDLRYRWMLYKSKLRDSGNHTNLKISEEPRTISKKSGGICSYLQRVCCAALPLQLLLLLLLLLLFLLPLLLETKNCALSNNFARSFNLMLKYEGPPPT